jgi:hypothetical protein
MPWRIVEILSGCVVEDATGVQLGVFYGRTAPNNAGHTGFLTMEEARQMAVDFSRLPELADGRRQPGGKRRGRDELTEAATEGHGAVAMLERAASPDCHTDRMFCVRAEIRETIAATHVTLAQSQHLLGEADAILAKGCKALIQSYYRIVEG